jgi:hypothetical protein
LNLRIETEVAANAPEGLLHREKEKRSKRTAALVERLLILLRMKIFLHDLNAKNFLPKILRKGEVPFHPINQKTPSNLMRFLFF